QPCDLIRVPAPSAALENGNPARGSATENASSSCPEKRTPPNGWRFLPMSPRLRRRTDRGAAAVFPQPRALATFDSPFPSHRSPREHPLKLVAHVESPTGRLESSA